MFIIGMDAYLDLNATETASASPEPLSSHAASLRNCMIVMVATLLIAWMAFKLTSIMTLTSGIMREVFLFWNIAMSASRRTLKKPLRLHPYLCETSYLDEVGVNELFHFYIEDFNTAQKATFTARDMHKVIMQYTHVLMCRDRMDGTLRGAMLLGIEHKDHYTLIKYGLSTFKNYYRGSPFMAIITASLVLSELIKHPLTPVYLIAKVYSYKAYLLAQSAGECYPVYKKETPEHLKKIFAEFAAGVVDSKAGRAKYNPDTFVIENEDSCLAENLTVLSEQDLQNPHIKFFVERNPGWKKGHCLVIGAYVTWTELLIQVRNALRRFSGQKRPTKVPVKADDSAPGDTTTNGMLTSRNQRRKRSARTHPQLLKRYTFQEMTANTYAVNNLEYDLAGEVVLTPVQKATFAFQTEADVTSSGPTDFNIDLARLI